MRWLLNSLGALMFVAGGIGAFVAAGRDTTTGEGSDRIHNIGLIGKQQADTTLWSGVAIAGAVFIAGGSIAGLLVRTDSSKNEEEEASEKADRRQMVSCLRIIAESMVKRAPATQAPAQRQAVPAARTKADDDFDAAIAADVARPPKAQRPLR